MSENGHSATNGTNPNGRVDEKGEIKFSYGGQAVIEGVMMRGAHTAAIAVRDPNGQIVVHEETLNATLEIVKHEEGQKEFKVLPKRWVVERTLAWLGNYRRLSKDYERLTHNSEGMIYLASIKTMLNRLAA